MLRVLQRILIFNIEFTVMYIVHDHIHAAEVIGGGIAFLTEEAADRLHLFGYAQQQRPSLADGVIDALELFLASR